MTGRCLVCEPAVEHAKHTHLIATLASGRELRFVDPRRFGKLQVLEGSKFAAAGSGTDRRRTASGFVALFKGRKTPIKSALLNQWLLSGIGNIYADESLFRAGVRPRRRAASLTRAELMRLYDAIQQVLAEAIRAGGRRSPTTWMRAATADFFSYSTGFTSARASLAWFAAPASNGWWWRDAAATIVRSASARGGCTKEQDTKGQELVPR